MFTKVSILILLLVVSLVFCDTLTTHISPSTAGEWKKVDAAKGAPPLERPLHACSVVGNKMYIFGGRTGLTAWSNTLHTFNFDDLSWQKVAVEKKGDLNEIPSLVGHSMTKIGNDLYIFGGRTGLFSYNADLYKLDTITETLTKVVTSGNGPSARQGHTAIAINGESSLLVHGGNDGKTSLSDSYILNINDLTWTAAAESSVAAEGMKSIHLQKDNDDLVYVFGGSDGKDYTDKIRLYSSRNNTWTDLKVTSKPRAYHSAARIGNYVYLFGGLNSQSYLSSTSIFSLAEQQWVESTTPISEGPTARQGHCAVTYGSKVVVWGGSKSWQVRFNDLWILETQKQYKPADPSQPKKELSELIEEALARVNLLLSDAEETGQEDKGGAEKIEREAIEVISIDDQLAAKFDNIPHIIKRCHEIELLHSDLGLSRNAVTNVTSTIKSFTSDIEQAKKDYIRLKQELFEEATQLRNKLNDLKNAEEKVGEEERKTYDASQQYESSKARVRAIEATISGQDGLRSIEKKVKELELVSYSHHKRLDQLTAIIVNEEENSIQSKQTEKVKLEELERLRSQTSEISLQVKELNELVLNLTKDVGSIDRGLQKWKELASEADDVKKKLLESILAEKNYSSAKSKFIEALKHLREDGIPEDVEAEKESLERKGKDLQFLDEFIREQEKKLQALKTEKNLKLKEASDEIRRKKAKLRELEDNEQQILTELDRIRERLSTKETNHIKYKSERDEADRLWRETTIQLDALNAEFAKAKEQQESAKKELGFAKDQSEKHYSEHQAQISREAEAKRDLDKVKAQMSDLYDRLVDHLRISQDLASKIQNSRRGLKQIKSDYDVQREDIVKFSRDLEEKLQELNEQWAARLSTVQQKLDKCESDKASLQLRIEALEKQLAQQTKTVDE